MPKLSRKLVVRALLVVALLSAALFFFWQTRPLSNTAPLTSTGVPKPTIVVSIYPLAYFTERLVGDTATVLLMTPAGIEPHEYEPSPQDIAAIEHSSLLVLNGGGLEPWADGVDAPAVVVAGANFGTDQDQLDPHIWLDPVLAQTQVEHIAAALALELPEHASTYQANAQQLIADLAQLDRQFSRSLTACRTSSLVTTHPAFGYLARRYNFTQETIEGISSEEDPSPQRLAELVRLTRAQQIGYIVYESPVTKHVADTLAGETGVQMLFLDPLEQVSANQDNQAVDYFSIQQKNAETLRQALGCKGEEN